LHSNSFTGSIPESIGDLTQIRALYVCGPLLSLLKLAWKLIPLSLSLSLSRFADY